MPPPSCCLWNIRQHTNQTSRTAPWKVQGHVRRQLPLQSRHQLQSSLAESAAASQHQLLAFCKQQQVDPRHLVLRSSACNASRCCQWNGHAPVRPAVVGELHKKVVFLQLLLQHIKLTTVFGSDPNRTAVNTTAVAASMRELPRGSCVYICIKRVDLNPFVTCPHVQANAGVRWSCSSSEQRLQARRGAACEGCQHSVPFDMV